MAIASTPCARNLALGCAKTLINMCYLRIVVLVGCEEWDNERKKGMESTGYGGKDGTLRGGTFPLRAWRVRNTTAQADKQNLLQMAADEENEETAPILARKEAGTTVRDNNGWTQMHVEAQQANVEVVRILPEHGADVTA